MSSADVNIAKPEQAQAQAPSDTAAPRERERWADIVSFNVMIIVKIYRVLPRTFVNTNIINTLVYIYMSLLSGGRQELHSILPPSVQL